MSEQLRVVRIFIGSPGGLDEERQAAHFIVNSINQIHSEKWGVLFKLLGWEHAIPGYIRPQSKINEDLDRCEYFVGVLWNRWGSRPSADSSKYTSGFEEEFFRAEERILSKKMKDMAIFFKGVDIPLGMKPGEEIEKVLRFRDDCIEQKKIFFKEFSDITSFKDLLRNKIEEIGWKETSILSLERDEQNQQDARPVESLPAQAGDPHLLDEEARRFLSDIANRSPEWERTSPQEVARFRLLASAVWRFGNDEEYLGNHDANLIYRHFRNTNELSSQEVGSLVECGVVGFSRNNVPLWHWLAASRSGSNYWYRLERLAMFGNDGEKRYALELLTLVGFGLSESLEFTEGVLGGWLSDESPYSVFEAAAAYVAACGGVDDVELLRRIKRPSDPSRRARLAEAIVAVVARGDANAALKLSLDEELDKIDEGVVLRLFRSPPNLRSDILASCLSSKSDLIRLYAVRLLLQRKELRLGGAEMLLTDSSHEVRLLAAEGLIALGVELSDDVAEKALTKSSSSSLNMLAGGESDGTFYERYQRNRLASLGMSDLQRRIESAGVFDQDELSTLYEKYTSRFIETIRRDLRDGFKGHFQKKVDNGIEAGYLNSELAKKIAGLEEFLRGKVIDSVVRSLCRLKRSEDLVLVREVLDTWQVVVSSEIADYLRRFGDWSDIARVLKLSEFSYMEARWIAESSQLKAETLIGLGTRRLVDLFALDLPEAVRLAMIKLLPARSISGLDDAMILDELQDENDDYRAVLALRCVQSLTRSRVNAMLSRYVDGDTHRYYNVVHWLDLGAAIPSKVAKQIAARALSSG